MAHTLGYMITFRTYGTWLPGDKRGWFGNGVCRKGDEGLEELCRDKIQGDGVTLDTQQRKIVRQAMQDKAEGIGEDIVAVFAGIRHVHVVLRAGAGEISDVVSRLKSAAYYRLRDSGFSGKLWARGYDTRYCFSEASLWGRVRYVEEHGL